jgi:hypothetical protein
MTIPLFPDPNTVVWHTAPDGTRFCWPMLEGKVECVCCGAQIDNFTTGCRPCATCPTDEHGAFIRTRLR